MKKATFVFSLIVLLISCKSEKTKPVSTLIKPKKIAIIYKYGLKLNNYKVINDTIKKGESFGEILDRHHVDYPVIHNIATTIKDTFDVRRVRAGKPYTILTSKDSTEKAEVFIYKHSKSLATVVQFNDSTVHSYNYRKKIKTVEKEAAGIIYTNLSNAMDSLHLRPNLTYSIADDIYAWTLDFNTLQKGDRFKIIYEENYIDDSIFVGYGNVKAAVFTHEGRDLYAYRYVADKKKGIVEYYDEKGNTLRSQFLKSPIKFKYRISSRYNLKRKIAYYGNRIKPHKGTDFAAPEGTPIMATASGIVTKASYTSGNGKYVKIKHTSVYSTQYLHMSRRNVKRGQYVKQGDIIGWVGHTGHTEGRHVCYRFWKNGRQVDPFKQKLPSAAPLKKALIPAYKNFIASIKKQLDEISFKKEPLYILPTTDVLAFRK